MKYRKHSLIAITLVLAATSAFSQQIETQASADTAAGVQNIQPIVSDVTVSQATVTDVHLRPLFATTIRLPDIVSSVAVGAPTLFEAEHSNQEPRLVYVKPSTKEPSESNLIITMQSGQTISMRLISDGSSAVNAPVDFIVDYKPQQSFFVGSTDAVVKAAQESRPPVRHVDPMDTALEIQSRVATPAWQQGTTLERKSNKADPSEIVGALGDIRESTGNVLVAYSVKNQSSHWIEVLPPQIEVSSPGNRDETKKKDKKHIVEAEQVPVDGFKVNGRKLAPGQRADGVVAFERPGFKQSQERILLQLASANSVDKPLLLAVPFVAPGN